MTSIRSKIVFTLVSALILSGLVTAWATFYSTRAEFSSVFDNQLKQIALELVEKSETNLAALSIVGQTPKHRILVQLYDAASNRLFLSEQLPALPLAEKPGFSTFVADDGSQWRQYTSAFGTKIVQVGQPLTVRTDLAVSAAMRIIQPMLVLLPFLAIAIWLVIVQALQPLNKTARAVNLRSPGSLTPISTQGLPFELKSLVDAINDLLVRLETSLSAQQRFASDAAHELRTPLAAIKLQGQLLSRAQNPDDRAKYALRLQQGVGRATRLVEQLLSMARLDPEAADKPMDYVSLDTLAQSIVEELRPVAQTKSITLTCAVDPAGTVGAEDALRLMMSNLTDNAIRYTPESGRIELGVHQENDRAVITVTDNGPGIPVGERQRVFERFYRALGTKVSGTGLGLAIVSRIVQMHSGTIHIEDGFDNGLSPAGYGACFVVSLPLHKVPHTA